MIAGWEKTLPLTAAAADQLIGDPRSPLHPVVIIGKLISVLEKHLRHPWHSPIRQKVAGAVLVTVVLLLTYMTVHLVMEAFLLVHPLAALVGGAIVLSFSITPRSLAEAGNEIKVYLLTGNIVEARRKVGWIVGRDTDNLDEAEVTRATVETVAENIVDGIISPLFYFLIGGVPLAFLYRAVNTLDSMVGYKNEKYLHFGMIAARVDDIFNYIPARITGLMIVVVAFILGFNGMQAARMILRDAAKHPSPNSGIAEAAVAGALGVRLGGLNYYGGVPSFRAFMGDEQKKLSAVNIEETIKIMYGVTLLWIIVAMIVL